MHRRFTVSLIPLLVLVACGPGKDTSEGDSSSGDATAGTTEDTTTGATTGDPTGDAPTGTATDTNATTDTGTTGTETTGDPGQPLLCHDEPANTALCVEVCVRDLGPDTALVDPNCRVVETRADMSSVELPTCIMVMDTWQPPAGAEACFAVLTDKDGKETPSLLDNMSNECVDDGHNAEIFLVRTVAPMDGACAAVICEPSPDVMRDCPNL